MLALVKNGCFSMKDSLLVSGKMEKDQMERIFVASIDIQFCM